MYLSTKAILNQYIHHNCQKVQKKNRIWYSSKPSSRIRNTNARHILNCDFCTKMRSCWVQYSHTCLPIKWIEMEKLQNSLYFDSFCFLIYGGDISRIQHVYPLFSNTRLRYRTFLCGHFYFYYVQGFYGHRTSERPNVGTISGRHPNKFVHYTQQNSKPFYYAWYRNDFHVCDLLCITIKRTVSKHGEQCQTKWIIDTPPIEWSRDQVLHILVCATVAAKVDPHQMAYH